MKIIPKKIIKVCGFIPLKVEPKLIFNQREKQTLQKAYKILDEASDKWEKAHPELNIDSSENQLFVASIELKYILDRYF